MKVGDLVKKRWGRIDPDINGQVGIIMTIDPGRGKVGVYATVILPCGIRAWHTAEMEVIHERR